MRVIRVMSSAVLAACLVLPNGTDVSAEEKKNAPAKKRKESQRAYAGVRPSGAAPKSDSVNTITEYRNELGQTVYSIKASRFDISRPLLEMSAATEAVPTMAEAEDESERASERPLSGLMRSGVPDPVVQSVIQPGLAAPTTGFNFEGVSRNSTFISQSDSNGSVGNNQFVETVNARYQVWSLNRGTQVATSILGPHGPQHALGRFRRRMRIREHLLGRSDRALRQGRESLADLAIHDRTSPTVPVRGGFDELRTRPGPMRATPFGRTRRASTIRNIGVWSDAYYMMAHAFPAPGGLAFAAMDRAKMLAANPGRHLAGDRDDRPRRTSMPGGPRRVRPPADQARRGSSSRSTRRACTSTE